MVTDLENRFIKYDLVKKTWDATHKYHSKKNDKAKIAQLVSRWRNESMRSLIAHWFVSK